MPSLLGRVLLGSLAVAEAFYLPGVAPHEYANGEKVEIKVNKLSSIKTQVCTVGMALRPPFERSR